MEIGIKEYKSDYTGEARFGVYIQTQNYARTYPNLFDFDSREEAVNRQARVASAMGKRLEWSLIGLDGDAAVEALDAHATQFSFRILRRGSTHALYVDHRDGERPKEVGRWRNLATAMSAADKYRRGGRLPK